MALSLESIYRPFNEFFVQKFAADSSPAKFRFDRLPKAFADHDFLTPLHPEWGPSTAVAQELLSTLIVDGITVLDGDGQRVALGPAVLSDLYHDEILGPAIPLANASASPEDQQAMTDAFNAAKADAVRLWELKALSVLTDGAWFRPSVALPDNWWDRSAPQIWVHQSFQVQGGATSDQPGPDDAHLLRMKIDNEVLRNVIRQRIPTLDPGDPFPIREKIPRMFNRAQPLVATDVVVAHPLSSSIRSAVDLTGISEGGRDDLQTVRSFAVQDQMAVKIASAPFRNRVELQEVLAINAPTQPVTTSDVTITFEYCVVNVSRKWFHAAFINNRNWHIPGQTTGQLSANDGHGLPALPVGFVAIKNLSIQAPWTPEDIANLEQSVQFGPFNFDSQVVDGAIGHSGIQIIGWMLQDLPDLPPAP